MHSTNFRTKVSGFSKRVSKKILYLKICVYLFPKRKMNKSKYTHGGNFQKSIFFLSEIYLDKNLYLIFLVITSKKHWNKGNFRTPFMYKYNSGFRVRMTLEKFPVQEPFFSFLACMQIYTHCFTEGGDRGGGWVQCYILLGNFRINHYFPL